MDKINTEIRVSRTEIETYHDAGRITSYINGCLARNLARSLLENKKLYIQETYDADDDYTIFTATLYTGTKAEYDRNRGLTSEDSEDAYQRGVKAALERVASIGIDLQGKKLKRDQHAGSVLSEVATEVLEELSR